jgi:hypothetical protein
VRWGNNVPKDLFHIPEILSFYPEAKVIVCIRDVRDFLLSYKNRWRTTGEENAARIRQLYHPVLTSFLWRASAKQAERLSSIVPARNLMMVRYEDLVQDPLVTAEKLCSFVEEKFEPDMLSVREGNSSFQTQQQGIYSSSVGRWRRLLTNEEIYIAQTIAGDHLARFGYTTGELKTDLIKIAYLYGTLPLGLLRALHANRAHGEPLLPYIARRFGALR